jgi:hypothetical protein
MKVWLGCEFTSIEEPELLSVGLISEDGRECYVELLDEGLKRRSSEFVHQQVLPLFGRIPESRAVDGQDMCRRLERFLLAMGGEVELLYDHKTDRDLVLRALERAQHWRDIERQLSWRNVSIETCSDQATDAMDAVFRAAELIGLGRHHALVDARALRMTHLLEGHD